MMDLRGIAPDATSYMRSEEFVRKIRAGEDPWDIPDGEESAVLMRIADYLEFSYKVLDATPSLLRVIAERIEAQR